MQSHRLCVAPRKASRSWQLASKDVEHIRTRFTLAVGLCVTRKLMCLQVNCGLMIKRRKPLIQMLYYSNLLCSNSLCTACNHFGCNCYIRFKKLEYQPFTNLHVEHHLRHSFCSRTSANAGRTSTAKLRVTGSSCLSVMTWGQVVKANTNSLSWVLPAHLAEPRMAKVTQNVSTE